MGPNPNLHSVLGSWVSSGVSSSKIEFAREILSLARASKIFPDKKGNFTPQQIEKLRKLIRIHYSEVRF